MNQPFNPFQHFADQVKVPGPQYPGWHSLVSSGKHVLSPGNKIGYNFNTSFRSGYNAGLRYADTLSKSQFKPDEPSGPTGPTATKPTSPRPGGPKPAPARASQPAPKQSGPAPRQRTNGGGLPAPKAPGTSMSPFNMGGGAVTPSTRRGSSSQGNAGPVTRWQKPTEERGTRSRTSTRPTAAPQRTMKDITAEQIKLREAWKAGEIKTADFKKQYSGLEAEIGNMSSKKTRKK